MVEEHVGDGRRIAQLLASELSGLDAGPLGDVSVVDPDVEAEPASGGARAYDVAHAGEGIATVTFTKRSARMRFAGALPKSRLPPVGDLEDLSVESDEAGPVLVVGSGAAVKRAVDVLADAIE